MHLHGDNFVVVVREQLSAPSRFPEAQPRKRKSALPTVAAGFGAEPHYKEDPTSGG